MCISAFLFLQGSINELDYDSSLWLADMMEGVSKAIQGKSSYDPVYT